MGDLVKSCRVWLRRNLPWSNTRRAWQERTSVVVLLAGLALVSSWADRVLLWQQVCLWGTLFLAAALLLRRGWLKLLGPVFLYELIRATRRSRYVLLRVYVYFIVLIYLVVVLAWWVDKDHPLALPANKAVTVARPFFFFFMSAQLMLLALVTPGYTAGAIADEKDRRTLEAVLATDLRNREIVLSKLVVRFGNLVLMLLTGLPILTVLQMLAGIDPDLTVAGLVATVLTMASLASLSILNSVYARRSRDAILYTYLEISAYAVLSGLSEFLSKVSLPAWTFFWPRQSVLFNDAVEWFSAGNPLVVLSRLINSAASGANLALTLPGILRDYVLFHGVLLVLFAMWAAVRLRAVFLKQASQPKAVASARRWRWRRRVGNWPIVWKEAFVEAGLRFSWFGRILIGILVLASFVPAVLIQIYSMVTPRSHVTEAMSYWTRIVGAMVACLIVVGVAVRAATSISRERDRLTWDSLLTSPLDSTTILFGKWLGSLVSVRWGWLWLGAIWGLGSALGGLHALAIPLLLLACALYAGLLALVGLWFSLVCPTSLRAVIWTLFTVLAMVASFLVLPVYSSPLFYYLSPDVAWVRWLYRLNLAMAPPIALGRMLPFGWEGKLPGIGRKQAWEMEFALLGLSCWVAAAVILWLVLSAKFRRLTGRQTQYRPEKTLPLCPVLSEST